MLALHPNQVAAARARFRVSGGKSDRFDAFVLCELARTDHHRFRVLEPDSDQTKALRALCRGREDLVQARVALSNQLRAELERFWPGAIRIFNKLESPIALAFLEKYPSPIEARTLGEQRLAAFLARQHYSGGKTPSQLLTKLRSAPEGRAGETEVHTRRQLVLARDRKGDQARACDSSLLRRQSSARRRAARSTKPLRQLRGRRSPCGRLRPSPGARTPRVPLRMETRSQPAVAPATGRRARRAFSL